MTQERLRGCECLVLGSVASDIEEVEAESIGLIGTIEREGGGEQAQHFQRFVIEKQEINKPIMLILLVMILPPIVTIKISKHRLNSEKTVIEKNIKASALIVDIPQFHNCPWIGIF